MFEKLMEVLKENSGYNCMRSLYDRCKEMRNWKKQQEEEIQRQEQLQKQQNKSQDSKSPPESQLEQPNPDISEIMDPRRNLEKNTAEGDESLEPETQAQAPKEAEESEAGKGESTESSDSSS